MQVGLLRFVENRELRRVGDTHNRQVDVRVIAATNRPLRKDVAHGRFRLDLYFRLSVATCTIPPLRERLEDVEALVPLWVPLIAERVAPAVRGLTPGALSLLREYSWPGNARELRNVLEHAMLLASGALLDDEDIRRSLDAVSVALDKAETHAEVEQERLLAALERNHWKLRRTAASLEISRSTLWRKLKKLGLV